MHWVTIRLQTKRVVCAQFRRIFIINIQMEATHWSYLWSFCCDLLLYIFPVLMCAGLTASLVIDLRSFALFKPHPLRPPSAPALNVTIKGAKIPPLPPFCAFVTQSNNNFVKHAKLLKSPARDLGSCAASEPGRCKRREDPCNSVLVLPRLHTHTKPRE